MTTLTLQPNEASSKDTYLELAAPDTNRETDSGLRVRGRAADALVTLIRFDLSGIPAGARIDSATLTLKNIFQGAPLSIHRILPANSAWTEAGATWNYAVSNTTRWAGDAAGNGGADAGCSVSGTDYAATAMVTGNTVSGETNDFTLNTTEFALMVADNHGLLIKSTDPDGGTITVLASATDITSGNRPKLVVEYTEGGGEEVAARVRPTAGVTNKYRVAHRLRVIR